MKRRTAFIVFAAVVRIVASPFWPMVRLQGMEILELYESFGTSQNTLETFSNALVCFGKLSLGKLCLGKLCLENLARKNSLEEHLNCGKTKAISQTRQ